MNYRSVADLARTVRENLHRIPGDVDLVVGIPRSGLLAANLIALALNLKLTDLYGLLNDTNLPSDNVRATRLPKLASPWQARHVLVVDDSIQTGGSLAEVRRQVAAIAGPLPRVTYCAVYATEQSRDLVDIALELVPLPRAFEWNVMHRKRLAQCCVDIDGVLCVDPTADQNDDGEGYLRFMDEVAPCLLPTYPIGHLVTARLEKYRDQTTAWLSRSGIEYGKLHMLDLPDAATRRRYGAHASFKARVYREALETTLFIESNPRQAAAIAHLSGKPVLCHSTQELIQPDFSLARIKQRYRHGAGVARGLRRFFGRIAGR